MGPLAYLLCNGFAMQTKEPTTQLKGYTNFSHLCTAVWLVTIGTFKLSLSNSFFNKSRAEEVEQFFSSILKIAPK